MGDECTFFSGGTPKSTESSFYGGNIPFICSDEIHGEKTELFLSDDGLKYSSAKMVSKGDLIVALYGATSGKGDILNIYLQGGQGNLSAEIIKNLIAAALYIKSCCNRADFIDSRSCNFSSDLNIF